jgi:DNA-binding XRE family transcriptional regulator
LPTYGGLILPRGCFSPVVPFDYDCNHVFGVSDLVFFDEFRGKTVGQRIRQLRGFDMTQQEFARRIGVSQEHFSDIERGEKEIRADILLRISEEFEKSIEWSLTGKVSRIEPFEDQPRDASRAIFAKSLFDS